MPFCESRVELAKGRVYVSGAIRADLTKWIGEQARSGLPGIGVGPRSVEQDRAGLREGDQNRRSEMQDRDS